MLFELRSKAVDTDDNLMKSYVAEFDPNDRRA